MRVFGLTAVCLAVGVVVWAAPVPKPKEDFGPITAEQLRDSANNLKQIGLGLLNYESSYGTFPNNLTDKGGKPLLSWRVAILPYVEEDELYRQFKLDEPWDSETNKKLIEKIPQVFAPVRVKTREKGLTFYHGFTGHGAAFEAGIQNRLAGYTDGLSNTVMAAEAAKPVVWTQPDDLPFNANKDLPPLGGLFDGEFHVLFADGVVKRVKKDFDGYIMRALITRNGGEVVSTDGLFVK